MTVVICSPMQPGLVAGFGLLLAYATYICRKSASNIFSAPKLGEYAGTAIPIIIIMMEVAK